MPMIHESAAADPQGDSRIINPDGTLTVLGETVADFLASVDFGAVVQEAEEAELTEEGVDAVIIEDGEMIDADLSEEALAVFAALDGLLEEGEKIEEARYKAMSRSALLKRMRNQRVQTADEKMRNRKARISRRRARAKLRMQRVKRTRRIGGKAELAAKRRGLGEAAANEGKGPKGKKDDEEYEDDEEDYEDVEEAVVLVPSELLDEATVALTRAGLMDQVEITDVTESHDEDGDAIDSEDVTALRMPVHVGEGLCAWLAGAELMETRTIPAEVVAEGHEDMIDYDDMADMFAEYLDGMAESADLRDRVAVAAAAKAFNEEAETINEAAFKKGDFKRIHKGKKKAAGKVGPGIVNSMLGAMIHKESIKKVKPGSGYTGGDYNKDTGYGPGTAKGIKKWLKASGRAGADGKQVAVKAVKGKSKKVLTGAKAKAANKAAAAKAAADAGAAKKAKAIAASKKITPEKMAKLKAIAAKAKGLAKGKKLAKAESHDEAVPAAKQVNESRHSSAALMGAVSRVQVNESAPTIMRSGAQPASATAHSGASMALSLLNGRLAPKPSKAIRALTEGAQVAAMAKVLPQGWQELGQDIGVLYTPKVTESVLRDAAKAAGWNKKGNNHMVHESATDAELRFLRDRMIVVAKKG